MTVRLWFAWLVEQGHVTANPARKVKELRRVQLAPKGLDRAQVRKLLREVERQLVWPARLPVYLSALRQRLDRLSRFDATTPQEPSQPGFGDLGWLDQGQFGDPSGTQDADPQPLDRRRQH